MEKLSPLAGDIDHVRQRRWRLLVSKALIDRSEDYRGEIHVQIGNLHRTGPEVADRMLEMAFDLTDPRDRQMLFHHALQAIDRRKEST